MLKNFTVPIGMMMSFAGEIGGGDFAALRREARKDKG
jgi:hypothetical protein